MIFHFLLLRCLLNSKFKGFSVPPQVIKNENHLLFSRTPSRISKCSILNIHSLYIYNFFFRWLLLIFSLLFWWNWVKCFELNNLKFVFILIFVDFLFYESFRLWLLLYKRYCKEVNYKNVFCIYF